jgi:hypothetical protein
MTTGKILALLALLADGALLLLTALKLLPGLSPETIVLYIAVALVAVARLVP